jgi:hypothetical protein
MPAQFDIPSGLFNVDFPNQIAISQLSIYQFILMKSGGHRSRMT